MGGEASGSNSGDDARGTQKQRGRNNAGYGDALGGGSTGSGNGNITPTPSGVDTLPGGSGNDKLGTAPVGAPIDLTKPLNTPSNRRSAPSRGTAASSLLGAVPEENVAIASIDKLGTIPSGKVDNRGPVDRTLDFMTNNPRTSAVVGAISPVGALAVGALANSKFGKGSTFDQGGVAGHVNNFNKPSRTPAAPSGPSPFGGDNNTPRLPTTLPRNPNTTPGATSKSATEPLTFLQRLTRQRGRAASTSVSGGQGSIASKTLLGG